MPIYRVPSGAPGDGRAAGGSGDGTTMPRGGQSTSEQQQRPVGLQQRQVHHRE